MPSCARCTRGAIAASRRAAKLARKLSGMCWTMTVGGQSAGKSRSTRSSASTPPVEAPSSRTRLFHAWLREEGSLDVVAGAVQAMADNGVIMEVSSAGLRQPFAEPYPCPAIMRLAADFGVDVCLASDAHDKADVGAGLADVARYARSFGFRFDTLPLRPDDIATRPAVLAQALDYLDGPLPRLRFSL